ncbi:hypothetical protein F2Q69_00044404 [Brassica cretica]|uniref:Uncharacterized protein n=1 Tax=Brassica cretica TaxID=69181 RepID=A0A8S9NLB5_BRACR|nr:hypothetical protein F2Q69_00044404 [Brassica cretica]
MLKQDEDLAAEAHIFLLYSVPDLLVESFLHPLRAYLKIQSKTLPLSICTAISNILQLTHHVSPRAVSRVWYKRYRLEWCLVKFQPCRLSRHLHRFLGREAK